MIRKAFVNGEEIPREAVQFEFERLAKFYSTHGMDAETLKKNVGKLLEKAQEQAIGAKLLILRAQDLGLTLPEGPDKLVQQVLAGVPEPEEAEIESFYKANKAAFGNQPLVAVQGKVREYLRHAARGRALEVFIAELRERYPVTFEDAEGQ